MNASADTTSQKSGRDVLWTTTTYLGEGLPWSMLHQVTTEYFTAQKVPLAQVGYTSAFHIAVTLKFLWSPFVDLFFTKRRWMLSLQFILGVVLLGAAFIAQAQAYNWLWLILGVFAILHATHDVACDGFYLQALTPPQQALYSGVRVAAFRVAMVIGGGGLVYLAGKSSWLYAFFLGGLLMIFFGALNSFWTPRLGHLPVSDNPVPHDVSDDFFAAYRTFLTQPHAALVLSFIFFFRLGDIMMFAMSKPLLRDLGVDTAARGLLTGLGSATTIIGSLFGGWLISRYSLKRCLVPLALIQNGAIPLYFLLSLRIFAYPGIVAVMLFEQLAAGLGTAAHTVFLMQRCRAAFSASHYAFATAVVALASTLAGVSSGHLHQMLGAPRYFFFAFVCSWPSLILLFFVRRSVT